MPSSRRDSWKTRFRSFYYGQAPEPPDPTLERGKLALLVIDVQNVYLKRPDPASLDEAARAVYDAWTPFHDRMHRTVIPAIRELLDRFRRDGHEVLFARIACQTRVALRQRPRTQHAGIQHRARIVGCRFVSSVPVRRAISSSTSWVVRCRQ
jgi:nicotinamidase-related amidase